jgi:hypothetical protein
MLKYSTFDLLDASFTVVGVDHSVGEQQHQSILSQVERKTTTNLSI